MSDEKKKTPTWVPVYEAVNQLRKRYEAADVYANEEVCFRAATEGLIRRLRAGQLASRASRFTKFDEAPPDEDSEGTAAAEMDGQGYHLVPEWFWSAYASCDELWREQDWIAGDFEYHNQRDFFGHGGSVLGLEVDENNLPLGLIPSSSANGDHILERKSGGRPPANWWPDFAEELAYYIYSDGIPEGKGHDGQSTMIDTIFGRMAEQGKAEPGRGTVQPVVNAVLRRIRSAGK